MAILNLFVIWCLVIGASLPLAGCANYGTGGTGEWIVPRQRLRDVQTLDLAAVSRTPPQVMPATTMPAVARAAPPGGVVTAAGATTAPMVVPPTSQPLAGERPITLDEVRQLALQNNLDIKVELFNPAIASESVSTERAAYEAVFITNANYSTLDEPTASRLVATTQQSGAVLTNDSKSFNIVPGVQIPLLVGGSLTLSTPMSWQETDNPFTTLNESYTSSPEARLTLPLLRGFGVAANARAIRVAFYESQAAQARTKLEVIRVLAEAERAYWRLYAARRDLEVRRQEHDLAVAQLNRARHQAEAGVGAEVDVVRAESGVSDTIETVINAENTLRNNQRALKQILNIPGAGLDSPATLVPDTPPSAVSFQLDAPRVVDAAIHNRMELLETELAIAQENANLAAARNGLLPLVTLDYTYTVNGLGTDLNQSWTMVRTADFQDHRLGLNVQIPIGNEAARSQLRAALLRRLQQLATREQRTLQIRQEALSAVDQLHTNWERIIAAHERVRLNARTLEAETRQFEQGLRTSTDVLDATFRLASAASAEIAAVTDYQISQIDVAFATGTLLGASQVHWTPAVAPSIDR
jgi:outer membrane protein